MRSRRSRLDRTLSTDVQNYLPGALLPKVDRMTMAHSLEARSPFLDHEVLELAARLPESWKVRGTTTKRILRELFAELLPESITRRGKMGFSVPLGLVVSRSARQRRCATSCSRPMPAFSNICDATASKRSVAQNAAGQADHGKRLWALLNLEIWLQKYVP